MPETFYVNEWVRLAPQKQAHVQVDWGDQYCGNATPTSIALSLPHSGGTLSATLSRSPGCNSTNLSDNGQLDVGGFVSTTGAPFTPLAGLQASIDHVSATTMPGGTVTYRLQLQSSTAQQVALSPCLPYRERLVNSSTGHVIEEEHLLNCADAPSSIADAHSRRLTYFDLHIAGSYALLWQSVLKPVNAYPDTDVRIGSTAPCRDGQLLASAGASGAATGHYAQVIVLRNVSAAACTLRGYPGIQLLSKDGRVMSPAPKRGSDFMFQDPGPQTVTLGASGGTASFSVGSSDYDALNQRPCPAATQMAVYAPETRTRLLVPVGFPVCSTGVNFSAVVAGGQGVR